MQLERKGSTLQSAKKRKQMKQERGEPEDHATHQCLGGALVLQARNTQLLSHRIFKFTACETMTTRKCSADMKALSSTYTDSYSFIREFKSLSVQKSSHLRK